MVPWQQIAGSAASLGGNFATYLGGQRAAAQEEQNLRRAQQIQTRNWLANLAMYEPNRALGYGAMSDLATAYGYQLPEYQTSADLARTTTPLGPKIIKQYLKAGLTLDQIAQMGTLATPNAKQLKKLRKAGLTGEQIQALMTPAQNTAYQGPVAGGDGTATGGSGQPGDFSRFFTSPDYQFRFNEGNRAVEQSGALGRTGLFSGATGKALTDYGSNIAAGEWGNYVNRLMDMAGIGERSQGQLSQVGTNTANQNSQYQAQIGDAEAAGAMSGYNAFAQHMQDLANIWGGSSIMGGSGGGGARSSGVASNAYGSTPFGTGSWDTLNAGGSGNWLTTDPSLYFRSPK
jgi:hypothetical protein